MRLASSLRVRASRAFDRNSRRAAAIASAVAITSLALAPIAPRCDDDPDGDAFVDLKGLQTWDENWDGRAHSPQETHPSRGLLSRLTSIRAPAPELKKLTKPPAVAVGGTRYIILVRHGQYESHGETDDEQGLTKLGHRQVELAGARIAEMIAPAHMGGDVESFGGARHRGTASSAAAAAGDKIKSAADAVRALRAATLTKMADAAEEDGDIDRYDGPQFATLRTTRRKTSTANPVVTPPPEAPPPPPQPQPKKRPPLAVGVVSSDLRRARETADAVRSALTAAATLAAEPDRYDLDLVGGAARLRPSTAETPPPDTAGFVLLGGDLGGEEPSRAAKLRTDDRRIDVERPFGGAPTTSALREGRPCQPTPVSRQPHWPHYRVCELREDGPRIEAAFRALFWRAQPEQAGDTVDVVCCHANVIRYFVMRALQLPPEAWLRVSLAHGSITLLAVWPSGKVSLLALGDTAALPTDQVTRSNAVVYNDN